MYVQSPPISPSIQIRWTWYAGYYLGNKNEVIREVLPLTVSHGDTSIGQPVKNHIDQLSVDIRCRLKERRLVGTDGKRDPKESVLAAWLKWGYLCCDFIYIYIYIYIYINRDIGPAVRVFANGPGDLGSIPGRVIPKTLKMELDTTLLNTQHYKVRFKGKVEQSWEWSSALPYTLV